MPTAGGMILRVAQPAGWFLASSARHVLLDAALAVARGGHNRLWLAEHIRAEWIERYRVAMRAWDGCPFAAVTTLAADWHSALSGLHGLRHRLAKWRLKRTFLRANRARIEAELRAAPPAAMYVSCDTFHESQYALHLVAQHWPEVPRIHVEDGTAAYAYSFARGRWHDWPKEVVRRLRYGSWWRPCTLPGASGWLQQGLVMYPEHALAGLRQLQLRRLDPELLKAPPMLAFAAQLARAFGLDVAPVREADWIVTVANSRWSHLFPDYRALLARICRELLDRGQTVVLKRHPADIDQDDWLGLSGRRGFYTAPAALPIEVLLMLGDGKPTRMLGDASTCMMSSRWLRPERAAITMQLTRDGSDLAVLGPIFAAIGVTIVRDLARVPGELLADAVR